MATAHPQPALVPAIVPATLPATGDIFLDARGDGRALRVTWHHETDLVVLSLWRDNLCAGTFRLAIEDVPTLIDLLRTGLDAAYDRVLRGGYAAHDTA